MTALTRAELKEVLTEIFEERARVDSEDHAEHHQWIQERIKAEQDRREMYREVTKVAIQYSVPVMLAGAYYWFQGHWK